MNDTGPEIRRSGTRQSETPRAEIRLFVHTDLSAGRELVLEPDQAHYVLRVMRRGSGDRALLFNGRDGEWRATIIQATKNRCTLHMDTLIRQQLAEPQVCLVFCPVKKTRLDFLVEKSTELGVSRLQPVLTSRTVVSRVNVARLTACAREAAEQCERLSIPRIDPPVAFGDFVNAWDATHTLVYMDETGRRGASLPLSNMNSIMKEAMQNPPCGGRNRETGLLVGPEGGFTDSELDRLCNLPFSVPVTLGPRILRTETAALAALANWQLVFGDGGQGRVR